MENDYRELVELKHRYCYATDNADVDELLEVFTEDAFFDIGIYGSGSGHEAIVEYIDWFEETKPGVRAHHAFNPVLEIQGDRANGRWYYVVMYETPDGSFELGQGEYEDEYRSGDEGWEISSLVARRRITRRF